MKLVAVVAASQTTAKVNKTVAVANRVKVAKVLRRKVKVVIVLSSAQRQRTSQHQSYLTLKQLSLRLNLILAVTR